MSRDLEEYAYRINDKLTGKQYEENALCTCNW